MAGGTIELSGLTKRFGEIAVDNIDLTVANGEFFSLLALSSEPCEAGLTGTAHAVIRPERVRIETHGSAGDNRVPAMVERVVFLGAATQVMLRLAPGVPLQALIQNDGEHPDLAQGTPVHAYLPPDALRVLAGARGVVPAPAEEPLVAS